MSRDLICPECGTVNKSYEKKCPNCSHYFRDSEISYYRDGYTKPKFITVGESIADNHESSLINDSRVEDTKISKGKEDRTIVIKPDISMNFNDLVLVFILPIVFTGSGIGILYGFMFVSVLHGYNGLIIGISSIIGFILCIVFYIILPEGKKKMIRRFTKIIVSVISLVLTIMVVLFYYELKSLL